MEENKTEEIEESLKSKISENLETPKEFQSKPKEKIIPRIVEDEMKSSYLDYAMSVIVGRALPDVRDGLKPVHRRILFAMHELGMFHNKPFKKSARIVGEVLGKFHPHGDTSIYDALVRMAQDFSLRYLLIDGQGNFGCFTGDTKVKLTDGRDLSFKDLIKEHKQGKKNYTYTVNSKGLIEIAEIKNPRLTKRKEKVMKVVFDNGEEIKCTLDHRFMLKDRTYKEAQNLNKEDCLMLLVVKSNHKVKNIVFLNEKKDVYDLTIEGTNNFALASGVFVHNSVDGDSPAAQRYTEARLNKISEELLQDIEKETVKFVPNFDGTLKEPSVLPSKIPNLLINGSSGIAVGMATNIPPHNIGEVIDAAIKLIDSPNTEIAELMNYIKGPDFPTAGIICNKKGIINAYKTGRGYVILRARSEIEEKKNKQRIIISEIPYMVNKALLIESIADLIRSKKINGISDLRDESNREGIRVIIELKQGTNADVLLNQLYKNTRLQTTFGIMMIALVDNEPKTLNLKQLLQYYIKHRQLIVRKRTEFEFKKAESRSHILQGIIIALENLDNTISLIKKSKSVEEAKNSLISTFGLTEKQALAILDIKLQKLTSLEQDKIRKEQKNLLRLIEELKTVLASEQKILEIIKNELIELKENYNDSRRTEIIDAEIELEAEDLIEDTENVITITRLGYLKRMPLEFYKKQKRGGKGVIAAETKEEDFIEHLFTAKTHSHILFFTNKGKVYWLKVHQIPEASRQSMGKAIINLLNLDKDEKITARIPVRNFDNKHFLVMATKNGIVKKTNLIEYSRPRKSGIIAITLDNDELINVKLTDGTKNIILATRKGLAAKFKEGDVRSVFRAGKGVIGIRLNKDDFVVGMETGSEEETLLTVTENGYGKRSLISDYRLINRGGKGVINIKTTERNGNAVSIKSVNDEDELMFISKKGILIRTVVKEIPVFGRISQGSRLMRLMEKDKVVAVAKVVSY